MPTTLRPRLSRSSPRRKLPPSRSQSAAAAPDIHAPSRTVHPPFRLFGPFSAGLHRFQPNGLHGSRSYPRRHGVQFQRAHVLYHNFRCDGVAALITGCTERFMQGRGNLQAFGYYAYIAIYALALTRDHETWPCGESRRRDWLRCVPSPIEGRLLFQVTTHCLSCFLGLRGMARAAASTACFRRPPSHENRLRGSRKRLRCAKAARKQRKTLSHLAVGIPMLH